MLDDTNLSSILKDPSLLCTQAYVAGEWVDAKDGATFDVTNPARGDVLVSLPDLQVEDAKRAIDAAYEAQKDWAKWTGKERAAVIRKMYQLMVENADDLGAILTAEMGKPLTEAVGEINYSASFFEWFGEDAAS